MSEDIDKSHIFVCVCNRLVDYRSLISAMNKDDTLWIKSGEFGRGMRKYVVIKNTMVTEEYMKKCLPMCITVSIWRKGSVGDAFKELKSKGYIQIKRQSPEFIEYKRERGWVDQV